MEVRCSSCGTEYEFDDALVSSRGTSVKCTNCGHQFRVRREGGVESETWVVRSASGEETVFHSLRELQQGIVRGRLDPEDELTHGAQPPRPLKEIYELRTFFATARARAAPRRTLLGGAQAGGLPLPVSSLPPPRRRAEPVTPVGGISAAKIAETAAKPGPLRARSGAPVSSASGAPSVPDVGASSPAVAVGAAPAVHDAGVEDRRSRPPRRMSERPPPPPGAGGMSPMNPARPSRRPEAVSAAALGSSAMATPVSPSPPGASRATPAPWQNVEGLRTSASDLSQLAPPASARSRWIAALVVVGGLALVGLTVGKDYLVRFVRPKPPVAQLDPRVPALLEEANAALGRGDYEEARAAVAKAGLLAERDPTVAAMLARLELSHAETRWLELKLLEQLPPEEPKPRPRSARARAAAEKEAEERAAKRARRREVATKNFAERLQKAANALSGHVTPAAAPEPLEVVRARVNLLRLEGKPAAARQLVPRLSAQASEPLNAHALGALDLAEGDAGLDEAVGRLRVAARSEGPRGTSRAMLVYALCRAGQREAADKELAKLKLIAPGHPLLVELQALVTRTEEKAEQEAAALAKAPARSSRSASERSSPSRARSASRAGGPRAPTASRRKSSANHIPEDDGGAIERAATLHRQGDLSGAAEVYEAVLARTPNQIEALSGLGDIARQRHSNAKAISYYNRVLSQSPTHLPTVMASADMNWHAGRRQAAVNLYRRALGQVGTAHPYGVRALRRIEEFEKSKKKAATGAGGEAPAEASGVEASEAAAPESREPEPEAPDERSQPPSPYEPESPSPSVPEAEANPKATKPVQPVPAPGEPPAGGAPEEGSPPKGKEPSPASAAGVP